MSRVGGSPSSPLPFFVNFLTSVALDNIYIDVHAVQPLVFYFKVVFAVLRPEPKLLSAREVRKFRPS